MQSRFSLNLLNVLSDQLSRPCKRLEHASAPRGSLTIGVTLPEPIGISGRGKHHRRIPTCSCSRSSRILRPQSPSSVGNLIVGCKSQELSGEWAAAVKWTEFSRNERSIFGHWVHIFGPATRSADIPICIFLIASTLGQAVTFVSISSAKTHLGRSWLLGKGSPDARRCLLVLGFSITSSIARMIGNWNGRIRRNRCSVAVRRRIQAERRLIGISGTQIRRGSNLTTACSVLIGMKRVRNIFVIFPSQEVGVDNRTWIRTRRITEIIVIPVETCSEYNVVRFNLISDHGDGLVRQIRPRRPIVLRLWQIVSKSIGLSERCRFPLIWLVKELEPHIRIVFVSIGELVPQVEKMFLIIIPQYVVQGATVRICYCAFPVLWVVSSIVRLARSL